MSQAGSLQAQRSKTSPRAYHDDVNRDGDAEQQTTTAEVGPQLFERGKRTEWPERQRGRSTLMR